MGLLSRLLRGNRLYQALAYAYDAALIDRRMRYSPQQFARCGEHVQIDPRVSISHPSRVVIGDWTTIQTQVVMHSVGGIHIGSYVGIGYRVMVLTFEHRYRNAKTIPFDDGIFLQPVVVRDFAWVGWGSMLMPGVEIGEGAIVSMGSVVTKSVPPRAIVIGNPATVIGYRSREHFDQCKAEGRVNPHRILEVYGRFEELIPLMTRRRYAPELREIGLLDEES
jgi:acetyltransferase-like isoleucine patch superfamily enzyme